MKKVSFQFALPAQYLQCFHAVRLRRQSHWLQSMDEWNIIEVNGSKVTPGEAEPFPLLLLIQRPEEYPVTVDATV